MFKSVDILQFNKDFEAKFGFDFYPYLNDWFNGKEQPGFLFDDPKATEIIVGDRSRYQVTFVVSNPEPVAGLFNISFRTGSDNQRIQTTTFQSGGGGGGGFTVSVQGRGMEAEDILKIVFLGPHEAKKIGIVLDAQPRALIVNTLFAKNIPGEITTPINDILKTKNDTKEFSGEETLASIPALSSPSEIIVDNEDPGFLTTKQSTVSPLKKLLGISNEKGKNYMQISGWNTPEYWQPVVLTSYYGKYVRSAVYTRSGVGDKKITWTTVIKDPGYYDIYSYVGKTISRMSVKNETNTGASGDSNEEREKDDSFKGLHFKIYNDQGVDDITLDYQSADGGWNNLGRFWLSADTARVELTNKSEGRIVIGDAIKWVKVK
jgi:hypothetical protein